MIVDTVAGGCGALIVCHGFRTAMCGLSYRRLSVHGCRLLQHLSAIDSQDLTSDKVCGEKTKRRLGDIARVGLDESLSARCEIGGNLPIGQPQRDGRLP